MIRKLHRASDPELDAQLDLILKHLHDDKYSLLKHLHDERYPLKANTLSGYGIVDAYTKVEADSKFNERPGTIKFVARATPWDGWLKANGALLSRVDYADLWAEAQDSGLLVSEATWAANNKGCYSTGNGSTTFRIPDLRGRTVIGAEQGGGLTNRQIGSSGGAENHILTIDQMPGHNHATSNGNSTTGNATGYGVTNAGVHTDAMYWNFGNSGYSSMTGGGQSHNNMQPYAALLACIKY